MSDMIEVTKEDGNNYCLILTALGMEEEGDPVAEIIQLIKDKQRIDWLADTKNNTGNVMLPTECIDKVLEGDLRGAIDEAMKLSA